ncbi:DUF5374 domain-containing protein [Testudinibacter sp. P27/CKL/0425]
MILTRYKWRKGASLLAVLWALMLFSLVLLSTARWLSAQQHDGLLSYQRYQALLIAQNQATRQRLGLDCEAVNTQNQLHFQIACQPQQVQVRFALGELKLPLKND